MGWISRLPAACAQSVRRSARGRNPPRRGAFVHKWTSLSTAGGQLIHKAVPHSLDVEQLAERGDFVAELLVLPEFPLDLLAAMQDRAVVLPPESLADTNERRVRLLTHEVHGDLAGANDLLVPGLATEDIGLEAVVA